MVELIANQYGTALFELALESDQLDHIENEVLQLKSILEQQDDLIYLLNHPQIDMKNKITTIQSIFNGEISDDVLGLIELTIKKGRQNILVEIIDIFLKKGLEYKGIIVVQVTTITTLSEVQKSLIKKKFETITNKTIILEESIDETLIGGIIIRIGDRILDHSIKGRLNELSKQLLTSR